jgi:ABC-2 type transport system permease protein
LAVVISFAVFYGFDLLTSFFREGNVIGLIENAGINAHYKSVSRGVIDSRDLIYFLVVSYLFLFFTEQKISRK